MVEFGIEILWTLACALRDVIVGDTKLRRQIETMLLQAACKRLKSGNKRFCSIPLTFCTPHIATIPSLPPLIFRHHSLVPCISLYHLLRRPSSSTLQTTRVRHPYDVLHASHLCHPIFPALNLLVLLTWRL